MPVVCALLLVLALALIRGACTLSRLRERAAPPPPPMASFEDTPPWARWRRPRDNG